MILSDQLFNWFDHKVHQSEKINSLQLLNPEINIKWHDHNRLEKLKASIKILKKSEREFKNNPEIINKIKELVSVYHSMLQFYNSNNSRSLYDLQLKLEFLNIDIINNKILDVKKILEPESYNSPHRSQQPIKDLTQNKDLLNGLKEIKLAIDKPDVSNNVKKMMMHITVAATILGLKPSSYIAPNRKNFFITGENVNLSNKELNEFRILLKKFNIDSFLRKTSELREHQRKTASKLFLITIYHKDRVVEAIKGSGLFTNQEIEIARRSFEIFTNEYLSLRNRSYKSVYRVGVIYGYPIEDVVDFIKITDMGKKYGTEGTNYDDFNNKKILDLLNKDEYALLKKIKKFKAVGIKGIYDQIPWKSLNPDSANVKQKIGKFEELSKLQRQVFR